MDDRNAFQQRVDEILSRIDPEVLKYDESEFWMVEAVYNQIRLYAEERGLINTAVALPLARGLHNGTYRKSQIIKNGLVYHLPYLIHPLLVCRMLAYLHLPMSREDEDVVLASALCHDMIEDLPFADGGRELYTEYYLDPRVYDTVALVSKRKDFSQEQEEEHFRKIRSDRFALLVKLSDRGNNVEDLYNMSVWKVHEYVDETRNLILPMCMYGIESFPDLYQPIEVLLDKILLLTETSETLVDRYEAEEKLLLAREKDTREENTRLRAIYSTYMETGTLALEYVLEAHKPAEVIIDQADPAVFNREQEELECDPVRAEIERTALEKGYTRTLSALELVRTEMIDAAFEEELPVMYMEYRRSLLAAKYLMNLPVQMSGREMDAAIAAVICHGLFEMLPQVVFENEYNVDEDVFEAASVVVRRRPPNNTKRKELYKRTLSTKAGVLAKIADHAAHVQLLDRLDYWGLQEEIRRTRAFILPLCTAAKEMYPEEYAAISVSTEKIRCLLEVTDILLDRYFARASSLTKEILSLVEENERLVRMIKAVSGN